MLKWLRSLFSIPQPSGPPQVLRTFAPGEPTITKEALSLDQGTWRIDATGGPAIRLFEVPDPQVEQCMLTYRAEVKTEGLAGRAYLEMWCRLPGRGEFFSKGLQQPVSGTTDWHRHEIPFYLKAGQRPDLIRLNLAIEGSGTAWLRDVTLLQTPLGS